MKSEERKGVGIDFGIDDLNGKDVRLGDDEKRCAVQSGDLCAHQHEWWEMSAKGNGEFVDPDNTDLCARDNIREQLAPIYGEGIESTGFKVVDYGTNFHSGIPPENNTLGITLDDQQWGDEADTEAYCHVRDRIYGLDAPIFGEEEDGE